MPGNGSVSFLSFFSILFRLSFTISAASSLAKHSLSSHIFPRTRENRIIFHLGISSRLVCSLVYHLRLPLSPRTLWHSALFLLFHSCSIFDPLFLLVALFIRTAHTAGTYSDVSTADESVCFSLIQKIPPFRSLSCLLAVTLVFLR